MTSSHHKAEQIDHIPLKFGVYKGCTPDAVSQYNPSYLVWAYENCATQVTCSKTLYEACRQGIEEDGYQPMVKYEDKRKWAVDHQHEYATEVTRVSRTVDTRTHNLLTEDGLDDDFPF